MKPTPEQLAKLPKWAQQHIAVLESNLAVGRMVRELNSGPLSPFWSQTYNGEPRRYIQSHGEIRFGLPGAEHYLFSIRPSPGQPERLKITSRITRLMVLPEVSNVIEIEAAKF